MWWQLAIINNLVGDGIKILLKNIQRGGGTNVGAWLQIPSAHPLDRQRWGNANPVLGESKETDRYLECISQYASCSVNSSFSGKPVSKSKMGRSEGRHLAFPALPLASLTHLHIHMWAFMWAPAYTTHTYTQVSRLLLQRQKAEEDGGTQRGRKGRKHTIQ